MNFLELWLVIASLGFSLAAPLGPVNTEMIKQIVKSSFNIKIAWFSSVLTGIGAMTCDFIIALLALTVGGELMDEVFSNPFIRLLLFVFNFILLGYLGISTLLPRKVVIDNSTDQEVNNVVISYSVLFKQYLTGFTLVATSPWSYLWWITVGTIILFGDFNSPDFFSRLMIIIFFLSGIFFWILTFSTILALIGKVPKDNIFDWIARIAACILLFFALLMIVDIADTIKIILTI